MKLRDKAIEKSGDVLIRLGEAAIIGSAASLFVPLFPGANSLYGFLIGVILVVFGLYLYI